MELLTILVNSDLSDLSRLQTFDGGRFLKQTGGRWLSQLAALSESLGQDSLSGMLGGLTPKTLSVEKDKAKMAWMTAGSSEPVSTFILIKVEGGWIPAGWGTAWEQIRVNRARLRELPAEAFGQQSRQKLETLARVDRTLDALLAADTAEEFQQTLANQLGEPTVGELAALVRTLSGASAPVNTLPPPTGTPPKSATDASSVTLIIHGAAGTEDEDRIFEALHQGAAGGRGRAIRSDPRRPQSHRRPRRGSGSVSQTSSIRRRDENRRPHPAHRHETLTGPLDPTAFSCYTKRC